jgi:hypothetical protein
MTMGISDILTLIGLLFAIFAFIYEGEGEFIFIKFNWLDVGVILVAFLLLNFLVYHEFYFEKEWTWRVFYFTWGLNSSTWAYIVSLAIIGYLFFRIFFGIIPFSNKDKLINFYKRLINKGDFNKVMGYIEKYHEEKIFEFHSVFQKNQHLEMDEYDKADDDTKFDLMRGDVEYKNKIRYSNQQALAGNVYRSIIERDDYIEATANEFPYFYSEILKYFNYKYSPNEEVVGSFFTTLLKKNNKFLKRELQSNSNLKEGQRYNYRYEEDNHLLKAMFEDIRVAEYTFVWKPFGETAIQEIAAFGEDHFLFDLYNSDVHTDSKFLDLSIVKSVRFFDIMVRQAIYKKRGFHMWLPYYYHFVKDILEVSPDQGEFGIDDWRGDYPTNYLYLIYRMTSNIYDWYHAMDDALYAGIRDTISKTMSGILLQIANSNSMGEPWAITQFELFIKIYCEVSTSPLNEEHEVQSEEIKRSIAESIERVMIRPAYGIDQEMLEYRRILKLAWGRFDRVPYEQTTVLDILQTNVFDKLQ